MIIITLENCKPCHDLIAKYPNVKYIELPRRIENADKDMFELKKRVGQLGIREFPALVNDEITEVLPLSALDK